MTFYNYPNIHYLLGNYNYARQQMLAQIQNLKLESVSQTGCEMITLTHCPPRSHHSNHSEMV